LTKVINLPSCLLSKNLKIKIYITVSLPIVLYGHGTWYLTLREAYRLRLFEERVPRKISGPKRAEIIGRWRKIYIEELYNLYTMPNTIRMFKSNRMRWVGHVCTTHGREDECVQCFGGKARRRPLGRSRHR
jgi:hypothetical protein